MNDSILLSVKGLYLILASGALHLATVIADATAEVDPTPVIKAFESLGPQGLLLAGIFYLYRANQKLEAEIKKMHEDIEEMHESYRKAAEAQLALYREQTEESNRSRDKLYRAIRGNPPLPSEDE